MQQAQVIRLLRKLLPLKEEHWVEVVCQRFDDDLDFVVLGLAVLLAWHLEHMVFTHLVDAVELHLLEQSCLVEEC